MFIAQISSSKILPMSHLSAPCKNNSLGQRKFLLTFMSAAKNWQGMLSVAVKTFLMIVLPHFSLTFVNSSHYSRNSNSEPWNE